MNRESIDRALVFLLRLVFAALSPFFLGVFVDTTGDFTLEHGFLIAFEGVASAMITLLVSLVALGISFSLGDPGNGQVLAEPSGVTWARRCILLLGTMTLLVYWSAQMMDAYHYGVAASGWSSAGPVF